MCVNSRIPGKVCMILRFQIEIMFGVCNVGILTVFRTPELLVNREVETLICIMVEVCVGYPRKLPPPFLFHC